MQFQNYIDHMFMEHLHHNSLLNEDVQESNYKQHMMEFGNLYELWTSDKGRYNRNIFRNAHYLYEFLHTVDIDLFSYLMYQCPEYK